MPPITMSKSADIDDQSVKKLQSVISSNQQSIDNLLNRPTLAQQKLSDFSSLLYTYANSKVDTGFDNLGKDFMDWLQTSKTSNVKQKRISEHIQKKACSRRARVRSAVVPSTEWGQKHAMRLDDDD